MSKRIPVMIGIIVVVIVAIIALSTNSREDVSDTPVVQSDQVYINDTYGYSLTYPGALQAQEYSPDNVVFGEIDANGAITGGAEARVVTIQGTSGESFNDAVIAHMKNLCAADGPTTSFDCVGNGEQITPFTSTSGLNGVSFYLQGELRNLQSNSTSTLYKGPHFAFPLQSGATGSSALIIHPPLNIAADNANVTLIRGIAESVELETATTSPADTRVQTFVSENISTLSPVEEQLGGTFFVTKITTDNGLGVVEYEDGHNAYVADFTYTINPQNQVSVTNFAVRE